jgi:transposase
MPIDAVARAQLVTRFEVLLPHLNERQQRLALGAEARLLGHGGVRAVAEAAKVSATTVRRGVAELESGGDPLPVGRVRRAGGGRKRAAVHDPDLVAALLRLVEPDERGDPMSPLRWTTKSLRHLAEELTGQGHPVSAPTVGVLLKENGFSLQGTAKTLEGAQHPDRDVQFRYINEQVKAHQDAREPVISVDAKKKEQLGQLPAAGREWRPKGEPVRVEDHSFFTAGPEVAVAVPYGVYDLATDAGWVNVGVDHDTSAFAVASIRRWWHARGVVDYPNARRLLITADAGGSNSYRYRLWKAELAAFAAEAGLQVTVCHFPPGTSKWNRIEHRLFSQITMNWRGRPLTSHEVVLATITATRTRTGLAIAAELDTGAYPLGIAVTRRQLQELPIQAHGQHGEWNYTIGPEGSTRTPIGTGDRARARANALDMLADERLTGMSRDALAALAAALAPAQQAQAAQRCFEQRGGPRRRAAGAGSRSLLSDADRVLVTVVYCRQICSQNVLSELLGINTNTIGQAIAETRQLLTERHHNIAATTLRFTSAAALTDFVTASQSTVPVRSQAPNLLSDPTLTGMSCAELAAMTERVGRDQDARNERHRHRRRGGERLPGARGGVFTQKITNTERVLAAVLYKRKLCTQDTLAELFAVSRRTIGDVVREVGPILTQHGYAPEPATQKFATAQALLDTARAAEPTTTRTR